MRTDDCAATYEAHEDKVWGLSLRPDEGEVLTGGADSMVCMWADVTAEETAAETLERQVNNNNNTLAASVVVVRLGT